MTAEPVNECEGYTANALARAWDLPEVHLFRRVGSTNDVARELAEGGAASGTAVLADEQLAGRGRVGRAWASPAGLGVWLSLVVRPRALPAPALLPLVVGLAAAAALDPFTGAERVMIKWPNDLTLGGRKLAGILCETSWKGSVPGFVVVGLGINVLHTAGDFPVDLRAAATSLHRETGLAPSRLQIAGGVARAVTGATMSLPARLDEQVLGEIARRDALRGRQVEVVSASEETLSGEACGIAPDGALLVRGKSGALRIVRVGTVRPVHSLSYV